MAGVTYGYSGKTVTYTVPTTGVYDIIAYGGQGAGGYSNPGIAGTAGGSGAEIGGAFSLTAGTVLTLVVGGEGKRGAGVNNVLSAYGGGGGGGTFVSTGNTLLIAAGGGGGGGDLTGSGGAGQIAAAGQNGGGGSGGAGGTGGAGGAGGAYKRSGVGYIFNGGGGAGWKGNGSDGQAGNPLPANGAGGKSAPTFAGGAGYNFGGGVFAGTGGFGGGGGGGLSSAGGGGGYSGGGGGGADTGGGGGGGGSYDGGTDQVLLAGENSGNGKVIIELNAPPAITDVTPKTVEKSQTTEIATVAPGLPGDTLTLKQTGGAGTLSLTTVSGVEEVIYTAPPVVPASTTDAVSFTISESDGVSTNSGTITVQLDSGPIVSTGSLLLGHGMSQNVTALIDSLVKPGLPGDTETITAVSGHAVLNSGTVVYTAPATGPDSFTYTVTDELGGTATGTVNVTVDPGPIIAPVPPGNAEAGKTVELATVKPGLPGDTLTLKQTAGTGSVALSLVNGVEEVLYTAPASIPAAGTDSVAYTITDELGDTAAANATVPLDPGPSLVTKAPPPPLALGQGAIIAIATPGLPSDTLSLVIVSAPADGTLSLVNNAVEYTPSAVPAGLDTFSYKVTDNLGGTTPLATGIVGGDGNLNATAAAGGYTSIILGNGQDQVTGGSGNDSVALGGGSDMVNLGGSNNVITAGNGNDTIAAGVSNNTVTVGAGMDNVSVTGGGNTIVAGGGGDTFTLAGSGNKVTAGNGNDTVLGSASNSSITLGDGQNTVSASGGGDTVSVGQGSDTVTLGGSGNKVTGGGGNDTVAAGTSGNTVTLGNGQDKVTATGGGNVISVGTGNDTIGVGGTANTVTLGSGADSMTGGSGDTIQLVGATHLTLSGSGEMVFLGSGNAQVTDNGTGLIAKVGPTAGQDVLNNFASDLSSGVVDLLGGIGGYTSAAQAYKALSYDGHGGTMLSLGSGASIDFTNVSQSALSAANFRIG